MNLQTVKDYYRNNVVRSNITTEDLQKILDDHKHWLYRDCINWINMRADFMDMYRFDSWEFKPMGCYTKCY